MIPMVEDFGSIRGWARHPKEVINSRSLCIIIKVVGSNQPLLNLEFVLFSFFTEYFMLVVLVESTI
jgi:hypothetical protein